MSLPKFAIIQYACFHLYLTKYTFCDFIIVVLIMCVDVINKVLMINSISWVYFICPNNSTKDRNQVSALAILCVVDVWCLFARFIKYANKIRVALSICVLTINNLTITNNFPATWALMYQRTSMLTNEAMLIVWSLSHLNYQLLSSQHWK